MPLPSTLARAPSSPHQLPGPHISCAAVMQAEAQYAAKMPPVLLLHGTDDTCALVKNVMQFEEALRKAGVKASGLLEVSTVSCMFMFLAFAAAVLLRGSCSLEGQCLCGPVSGRCQGKPGLQGCVDMPLPSRYFSSAASL